MKHAIWLVTILFFQSIAIAQNTSVNSSSLINENFQNVELKQVLTLLKTKYGIKSAYGEKIIRNKTVNAELINYPTEQVFARILSGTSLDYEMVENDLVIIRKQKQYNEKSSLSDLTGSVKDALSGESLPYAYVWLDKEKSSLVTNVDGYFLLTNVRLPATLKISYLGYKDTTFTISGSYSHKRINVDLVPTPQKLEEVVVTDQKTNDFENVEFLISSEKMRQYDGYQRHHGHQDRGQSRINPFLPPGNQEKWHRVSSKTRNSNHFPAAPYWLQRFPKPPHSHSNA